MGLTLIRNLLKIILLLLLNSVLTLQQDQNYFFTQNEGRFGPSFTNTRTSSINNNNNFFQQNSGNQGGLDSTRVGNNNNNNAPGSYQEQTIFIGQNAGPNRESKKRQQQQQETTPSYFQYTSFPTRNHPTDIFEISPRPFSLQNSGFPYTKQRNQQQQQQQTSSNEQYYSTLNQQQAQSSENSKQRSIRPYSNNNSNKNSLSNNYRPSSASNEYYSSQEDTFKTGNSRRNRFQPSTTLQTTQSTNDDITTHKRNRFSPQTTKTTNRQQQQPPQSYNTRSNKPNLYQQPRKPLTSAAYLNSAELLPNESPIPQAPLLPALPKLPQINIDSDDDLIQIKKPVPTDYYVNQLRPVSVNITHNGSTKIPKTLELELTGHKPISNAQTNLDELQDSYTIPPPAKSQLPDEIVPLKHLKQMDYDYYGSQELATEKTIEVSTQIIENNSNEMNFVEQITKPQDQLNEESTAAPKAADSEKNVNVDKFQLGQEQDVKENIAAEVLDSEVDSKVDEEIQKADNSEVMTTVANEEQLEDHTVILTSNFYLPKSEEYEETIDEDGVELEEKDNISEKIKATITTTSATTETEKPISENDDEDVEYEYEYEDELESESVKGTPPTTHRIDTTTAIDDDVTDKTTLNAEILTTDLPESQEAEEIIITTESIEEKVQEVSPRQEPEHGNNKILGQAVVSVVTTKSVINNLINNNSSSYNNKKFTKPTLSSYDKNIEDTINVMTLNDDLSQLNNTTESWVVVASVQTSRSVSGARFLPFSNVEQDEKKLDLSELEKITKQKEDEENERFNHSGAYVDDLTAINNTTETVIEPTELALNKLVTTTEKFEQQTESIIDKLDRVQSELSSDVLTGNLPILKEMPVNEEEDVMTNKQQSLPPPVVIRKFSPFARSTTSSRPLITATSVPISIERLNNNKKILIEELPMDNLSGLLPPGFKAHSTNYRNKKLTTTISTTMTPSMNEEINLGDRSDVKQRNATSSRSFKSGNVQAQDINIAALLPKGYKTTTLAAPVTGNSSAANNLNKINDLLTKIKFDSQPNPEVVDDISKFLPPGYKAPFSGGQSRTTTSTTTMKPLHVIPLGNDGISKFLPSGYQPEKPKIIEDISKFLPPDFKPQPTAIKVDSIDISKLLPPGFAPSADSKDSGDIGKIEKIEIKDISAFLPPDFKLNLTEEATADAKPSTTTGKPISHPASGNSFKVVFPSRIGAAPKRPGSGTRLTTPRTLHASDGSEVAQPTIRKGPPTRATTEFTGWPTPSTTPISIEKLLAQQKAAAFDISALLPSSSSTTTTTTTTSTTTTPRPTEPGLCQAECDLAGTIKIVDGVKWTPELLDHNTDEWKTLARDVEAQLNEVYSKAQNLNKWYKSIRIDSFSEGSVLVDYFVELHNLTYNINTNDIKKLFHQALVPNQKNIDEDQEVTMTTVEPTDNDYQEDTETYREVFEKPKTGEDNQKLIRETFLLGKFIVDPISTDFIVIPKQIQPTVGYADENVFLPQWAIAVIVIGLASLLFVILFGVTVLVNRQKRSKKKQPTPLTAEMLNELNKNHMGGIDNYGNDDFYNIEDAWGNGRNNGIKPKRFTNSMHGSSASNIYDSWRSQHHNSPPLPNDYYYEQQLKNSYLQQPMYNGSNIIKSHNTGNLLYPLSSTVSQQPQDIDYLDSPHNHNAMSMYTYNPRRYNREYDNDF